MACEYISQLVPVSGGTLEPQQLDDNPAWPLAINTQI
jgi:hypothetical protein